MLTGIRLKSSPCSQQKKKLSQWMGCARHIWNAKCYTDKEQRQHFKQEKKYPVVDQTYSQYKNKEKSPWLFDCPSIILRNSVSNWYATYQDFFKKRCGRPNYKKKDERGSIHLTRELFEFKKGKDGVTRLFIGSKTNNIGYLPIKNHKSYKIPNSIYIRKKHQNYWVSFCYEDNKESSLEITNIQHLKQLRKKGEAYLNKHTIGIDRGVARPVQSSGDTTFYDFNEGEKRHKTKLEKQIKRCQKKLSRQNKGSNRRYRTKVKLSKRHSTIANIRANFCHQTSHKLTSNPNTKVIVFEDLGTSRMTRKSKPKKGQNGKWLKNNRRAKAGLNKSILDKGWHLLEIFTTYKAKKIGKVVFKVSAHYTSQECANCHHIHPNNRKSQSRFQCENCGHTDNADINASQVIKKRAIKFILNSGTELSKRGVLSLSGSGRGASVRRGKPLATHATA